MAIHQVTASCTTCRHAGGINTQTTTISGKQKERNANSADEERAASDSIERRSASACLKVFSQQRLIPRMHFEAMELAIKQTLSLQQ